MKMLGDGAFGSRRRYLAEQAIFMEETFGKAAGFTTPITKPVASFKAPAAGGGASKPKVASLKPTGGALPSASQRLSALRQNLATTGPSSTPPAAAGAAGSVGKREARGTDHALMGLGGAGVLAATQADAGAKKINGLYRTKVATPRVNRAEQHLSNFKGLHKRPAPASTWAANDQGLTRGAARRQARQVNAQGRKKIQTTVDRAKAARNKGLISGKQRLGFQIAAGGGGALLAYAAARRAAVNKRDQRDVDSLAMGAAGGLAAHQGSYIPTKIIDNRAERKIRNSTAAQETVAAHKAKHGISGAKPGDPRWKPYFRSYPTNVPGGKLKRALAYTHSGKTGFATGSLAIGGGALGTERLRRGGKFQTQRTSSPVARLSREKLSGTGAPVQAVTKALKVKIIPDTMVLPEFKRAKPVPRADRPLPSRAMGAGLGGAAGLSRGGLLGRKSAGPRTIRLPKKRPNPSEVRAAIREKGWTTSAGKRRVTGAKEINDATTDAMNDYSGAFVGRTGLHNVRQTNRISKREPLKTSISEDDARKLVERHGLKGPLPKHLDREQKMAAYEARYVSAGGKKAERWDHRAHLADRVKTGGLAVATAGGAGWLATRGKLKGRALSPRVRHHAETIAGAGATAGGAAELYAGHARRKRSSYASAPAGVAASALTRMRAYTP